METEWSGECVILREMRSVQRRHPCDKFVWFLVEKMAWQRLGATRNGEDSLIGRDKDETCAGVEKHCARPSKKRRVWRCAAAPWAALTTQMS